MTRGAPDRRGEASRRRRERTFEAARARFKAIVSREIPATEAMPISERRYEEIVQSIQQAIRDDAALKPLRRSLRHLLHSFSKHLIDANGLDVAVLRRPQQVGRSLTNRSARWLCELQELRAIEGRFADSVERLAGRREVNGGSGASEVLALVLWSAATRGLLLEGELLQALCLTLQGDERPLVQRGADLTIRLVVARQGGDEHRPANCWSASQRSRVHDWSPDAVTLMLIRRYLDRRSLTDTATAADVCLRDALSHDTSLADLLRIAARFSDERSELRLPEVLLTVARGDYPCLGLDDEARQAFTTEGRREGGQGDASPNTGNRRALSRRREPVPAQTADLNKELYAQLSSVLKSSSQKHKSKLVQLISEFLQNIAPESVAGMLMSFLLDFLARGNKVSSAQTYFNQIGKRLLLAGGGEIMSSLDPDEIQDLYEGVIADVRPGKQRAQVAATLALFNGFCRRKLKGLPAVSFSGFDLVVHRDVRARHLCHGSMDEVVSACSAQEDKGEAVALMFAIILAYRAGLRLTEVHKLTPSDIEPSDELWTFIRPTRYGTLKSRAAKRRLPLGALLLPSEGAVVRRALALSLDRDEPIVAQVGDFSNKRLFSDALHNALKDKLGATWTFHHLRHAAANNLFLLLCDEAQLCSDWSGWDRDRQARILGAVTVHPTRRQSRFMALAVFMGHANPHQTFTSYVHLWPEAFASRIDRLPVTVDAAVLGALTNLRPDRLATCKDWQTVRRRECQRLSAYVQPPQGPSGTERSSFSSDYLASVSDPRSVCIRTIGALDRLERGEGVASAAKHQDLDVEFVVRCAARAQELAQCTTSQGNPRFGGPQGSYKPLLPIKRSAREDGLELFQLLQEGATKNKEDVAFLLHQFMRTARKDGRGIRVDGAPGTMDVAVFLGRCGVGRERLQVVVRHLSYANINDWKDLTHYVQLVTDEPVPRRQPPRRTKPRGSAELTISSLDGNKMSFSSVRIAFEMLFISGLVEKEVNEIGRSRESSITHVREVTARQVALRAKNYRVFDPLKPTSSFV